MKLPVNPPVSPMLAKLSREMPAGDGWSYEPKWDGFRCIVFRDGDEVELGSRNERPLTRYFPDLVEPLKQALPDRAVVDGEIVIATEHGLDFDLLSLRLHPAASRVAMLAEQTPASFVAFDLLAEGDDDLRGVPFGTRRKRLEKLLRKAKPPIHLTPTTTDPALAAEWFERFEGAGLDGVVAKPLDGEYREGERTMAKVKHQRTADCVVAGSRVHKDGKGVGSLLLGLFDDDGVLHHVGVASSFAAPLRGAARAGARALPRPRLRRPSLARVGRAAGGGAAPAGRGQPVERGQGPLVGPGPGRARGRGRVRAPAGGPVPPHRAVRAVAPRP